MTIASASKEPDIPRVAVKIIRKDDKIKLTVGKYSIELLPISNQAYDLVALEQFITKVASIKYREIIEREKIKNQVRQAFIKSSEDIGHDQIVDKLMDGLDESSKEA